MHQEGEDISFYHGFHVLERSDPPSQLERQHVGQYPAMYLWDVHELKRNEFGANSVEESDQLPATRKLVLPGNYTHTSNCFGLSFDLNTLTSQEKFLLALSTTKTDLFALLDQFFDLRFNLPPFFRWTVPSVDVLLISDEVSYLGIDPKTVIQSAPDRKEGKTVLRRPLWLLDSIQLCCHSLPTVPVPPSQIPLATLQTSSQTLDCNSGKYGSTIQMF